MSGGQTTEQAREGVKQAEAGDADGETVLDQAREKNPPEAEAAEQEAADGPEGRGLSR